MSVFRTEFVDEDGDLCLVGAQSCTQEFIEHGHVYVAFASSVPSNEVSDPIWDCDMLMKYSDLAVLALGHDFV